MFNQLSDAESERLYLLAEEAAEVIQAIGKILRHGYESTHPDGGHTNRYLLEKELGDVSHAMLRMIREKDINEYHIDIERQKKATTVKKYLHHN